MKLEEVILVTENRKGTETSYLSSFVDYLKLVQNLFSDMPHDVAYAVEDLFETKEKKEKWGEIYVTSNHTYHAKFCKGESELRGFLQGYYTDKRREEPFHFDKEWCSEDCLLVLSAYGLKTDGHSKFNSLHYEMQDYTFQRGEILRNLNGSNYLVLSVLDKNNLLLYAQNDGQILVGVGTAYYKRTPREGYLSKDSEIFGVEWNHGIYLGYDITKIDLEGLKKEYGKMEEIKSLSEYSADLKRKFYKHKRLCEDMELSEEVRLTLAGSMEKTFLTNEKDTFEACLRQGVYDDGFYEKAMRKKERIR